MSKLHRALESLRPKKFEDIPTDDLKPFLSDIFTQAELIANSVPPPPNGTPYESAQRTRTNPKSATSLADLTISQVRRPSVLSEHEELRKAWGKPLKFSGNDAALGISVFKMAGHDRHGAWFARSSVHEGLGFQKWKRAMMREFAESLEVQGGPGEGNVRGIGGDKRVEEIDVPGVGKLEVYQLSAQFPGPTAPREFVTLLLTSDNALSDASKVGDTIPRHYMIVSIPVTHPEIQPREGFLLGQYESVELVREIPLPPTDGAEKADPETNPVEWIMITRSDPGGSIPRFMVERNTPPSIVQDAGKFLEWACSREDVLREESLEVEEDRRRPSMESQRALSIVEGKGVLAGVGTSIADNPRHASFRRPSHRTLDEKEEEPGTVHNIAEKLEAYLPEALNPLHRTESQSSGSSSSSAESDASFVTVEQYKTSDEGFPENGDGRSLSSEQSPSSSALVLDLQARDKHVQRELEKLERKKQQALDRLQQAQEKQSKNAEQASAKTSKELQKAAEKHERERKKQEEKYAKELQKIEAKRARERKKLLAKRQKEADKNNLLKAQRERDEWKRKAELAEEENKLLQEQIKELQRENTAIAAALGKSEAGHDILKKFKEELNGKSRKRASSRASASSKASGSMKSITSDAGRSRVDSHANQASDG
ncbi:uncharacterized protein EI97DRAFT_379431 [Westerdykella ornata]|uniref:DUF3074 domain-containing protein n=1 Tax=Westerdykella ornata TaxID=318751 RepID=A0A6A6JGK6_WESOR|nr:uncharacterized protein EI97DRAFT_379431 [Westerdykella ornata]KAF2275477.1 hypothetical protein EI97DRAFT_379431 [Westerdykella ornata]